MACTSSNGDISRQAFGYSSHPNNWILDSGATCYMTPYISYFIPGSFVETKKKKEVSDTFCHSKIKRTSSNKMSDDNGKSSISKLYNILVAPDLCDLIFSIIV